MVSKEKKDTFKRTDSLAFDEFYSEFRSESDRAAVILGAARLDLGLYHLLQHMLLPNTSKNDELLEGDSPLSTFSARINICYRLGIIDADFTRSLHLIRKIRNVFAHETSGSSLDSGSHRDRVRELCIPFFRHEGFVNFVENHFSKFEGASRDFRAVLSVLVLRLDGGLSYMQPIKLNSVIEMIPDTFRNPKALGDEGTAEAKEEEKD